VVAVRRFRLVVELLEAVGGTGLLVGSRLSIDPVDHPHVVLNGPAAHAAHGEWLREFRLTGPQPLVQARRGAESGVTDEPNHRDGPGAPFFSPGE
jgi:hypothetical protein